MGTPIGPVTRATCRVCGVRRVPCAKIALPAGHVGDHAVTLYLCRECGAAIVAVTAAFEVQTASGALPAQISVTTTVNYGSPLTDEQQRAFDVAVTRVDFPTDQKRGA